jgi:hypothetical protein
VLLGRLGVAAVATLASIAGTVPAASAADTDLAPESSTPTPTPEPTSETTSEPTPTPTEQTAPQETAAPPVVEEEHAAEAPPATEEPGADDSAREPARGTTVAAEEEPPAVSGVERRLQVRVDWKDEPPTGVTNAGTRIDVDVTLADGTVLPTVECTTVVREGGSTEISFCPFGADEQGTDRLVLPAGATATVTVRSTPGDVAVVGQSVVTVGPSDDTSADVRFVLQAPGPQAQTDGTFSLPFGGSVDIDVLENDLAVPEGSTVVISEQPFNGSAEVLTAPDPETGRPVVRYTAGRTSGDDQFGYRVTTPDGGTSEGRVNLIVAEAPPVEANFGTGKFRVGTQIASGAFVPKGTTTVGSRMRVVITPAGGGTPTSFTCTTTDGGGGGFPGFPGDPGVLSVRAAEAPTGQSFCDDGDSPFGFYTAPAGATVEVTQETVPSGQALVADTDTRTLGPCEVDSPFGDFCAPVDLVTTSTGSILPVTRPDAAVAVEGGRPIEIDVLANDDSDDPDTGLSVEPLPADQGTIEVVGDPTTPTPTTGTGIGALAVPSAGTLRLRYTPPADFSGTVPVTYDVTSSNGSTPGALTITVRPAAVDPTEPTDPTEPVDDGAVGDRAAGNGSGSLPDTGGPGAALAPFGALLLAAGAAVVARTRRRVPGSR